MNLSVSRRLAMLVAVAAIFAMVLSPLGATFGSTQFASADESAESTPVAAQNSDVETSQEPADEGTEPTEAEGTPAAETPTEEPTVEETEVPTEEPTVEPTVEETVEPTAEATEVPATPTGEVELSDTVLEDITVTTYCFRSPEMTRVDNAGDTSITVISIRPIFDAVDGVLFFPEPADQMIGAEGTRIYRSGPAATYGTILSTNSLFYSTTAVNIEVEVVTSVGTVIESCGDNPNLQITEPTDVAITLSCTSNPELARIDNNGDAEIVIHTIESLNGNPAAVTVNRTLGAGRTVIYRSNSGATTGTLLALDEFYTDSLYELDGIRLNTSIGVIEQACPERPPTYPSLLEVTVDCINLPEWVKIKNVGQGPVTITGFESLYDKKPIEPFSLNKTLQPGQGVIYRSGTTGDYYNVVTSEYLYTPSVGSQEGVRIFTSTGKRFVARCADTPRIEVNLTTQMLYAYEGDYLVASSPVSTGKDGFLTPTGRFHIMTKEGTIDMGGCSGGECWYVPDVPAAMLFRHIGFYIHGAYWHDNFGVTRGSHGCVNLPVDFAWWLYGWARIGTEVWIHY